MKKAGTGANAAVDSERLVRDRGDSLSVVGVDELVVADGLLLGPGLRRGAMRGVEGGDEWRDDADDCRRRVRGGGRGTGAASAIVVVVVRSNSVHWRFRKRQQKLVRRSFQYGNVDQYP